MTEKDKQFLKEVKRLYDLGFAILWLKPRNKMPVKNKWTTGPRETWKELQESFVSGFNVGVRLGTPSRVGEKFLSVLDIDVKSTDPAHRAQAEIALQELFRNLPKDSVEVMSGRGNGSSHKYILTNEPAKPTKVKVSLDQVKVFMPSAKINEKQRELLSEEDLNEGYRMRPAWEISIMGEGQQVVLPPSIHPDSGRSYQWKVRIESANDLSCLALEGKQKTEVRERTDDWKPVEVDLENSLVSKEIVDLIRDADCLNKSDALMTVCLALVREDFTDAEILTILTDNKKYVLAETGYEHTKSSSRARAANWVYNYTLKKARITVDANHQFDAEVEISLLSEEESVKQEEELEHENPVTPDEWRKKLKRTEKGKVATTVNNLILILENTVSDKLFKRDSFALTDTYDMETVWGGKKDQLIDDDEILKLRIWFAQNHGLEPKKDVMGDAVSYLALKNAYHPVRDYLDTLEWDGKPRIDSWLKTYLKATGPEPYLSAISRKTLCAMIARVRQPGIKFDHVLILNGAQGIGKSTAAQILASSLWFLDRLPDLRDKDSMLNLQGIWVVEMGELANMRISAAETYKAFLTSQVDKFRLPYGRRRQDFPRQCIIIGSSNPSEFLNDPTGNRRFWPVKVEQCDFAALRRDRDQLLAEAQWRWENCGERLYLNPIEEFQAKAVQAKHSQDDTDTFLEEIWDDHVADNIGNGKHLEKFKLQNLFDPGAVFECLSFSKDVKRVTKLLRKKGYRRDVLRSGRKEWVLATPDEEKSHQNEGI